MTHEFNVTGINCELSMEELENVAGGGWFSSIVHAVEHGLKSFFTNPVVAGIAAGVILVGGIVAGGGGGSHMKLN